MIYESAPFPHWVIDDFLPAEMAWAAYLQFHNAEGAWVRRHHLYSRHKFTRTQGLPPAVEEVLARLESVGVRQWLAAQTGEPDLHADPERFGGGQHLTLRGGRLGIHADFTHHPTTGMRRALNLLLYLNAGWQRWQPQDGGELELWSADMQRYVHKVAPLHNRAVIFKTSVTSWHGHPEPLRADARRSLAVYYYVPARTGDGYLRTTDYRPRPWEYGLRARRWLSRLVKG